MHIRCDIYVPIARRHAQKKRRMQESPQCSGRDEDNVEIFSPRSSNKRRKLEDVYSTLNTLCTDEEAEAHSKETIVQMARKKPDEAHISRLLTVSYI